MSELKIDIAICTWNRADLLRETLEQLTHLHQPVGATWDLIVVNNRCTDHTPQVLAEFAARLPLTVLDEAEPGLSNARNAALRHTRGDYLIFIDDDVLVEEDWLVAHVAAMRKYPQAAYLGGRVEPRFEIAPPEWIRRHMTQLQGCFGLCNRGPDVRPFREGEDPFGNNMVIRRDVLSERQFDPRLGHYQSTRLLGEETELFRQLREAGHVGVWVGPAGMRHYVPAERLNRDYLWKWFHGYGRTLVLRGMAKPCALLWGAPRWAWRRYWESRLAAWCFSPSRGTRWLKAFVDSAMYRGMIDESRSRTQVVSA